MKTTKRKFPFASVCERSKKLADSLASAPRRPHISGPIPLTTPLYDDNKHLMMFAADLDTSSRLSWLPCLERGSGLSGSV